jgi:hypothetical protein
MIALGSGSFIFIGESTGFLSAHTPQRAFCSDAEVIRVPPAIEKENPRQKLVFGLGPILCPKHRQLSKYSPQSFAPRREHSAAER